MPKSFASKKLRRMLCVFRIFKCIHWQTVDVSVKGQLNLHVFRAVTMEQLYQTVLLLPHVNCELEFVIEWCILMEG